MGLPRNLVKRVRRRLPPSAKRGVTHVVGRIRRGAATRAEREDLADDVLDCMIGSNEHGTYCVPRSSGHRPVARAILRGQVWEDATLRLLMAVDGDIVHAGTYFGDFLPALARSRRADEIVWAFEPNLENYRCAHFTMRLNDLDNVVLTNAGLDSKHGDGLLQTANGEGLAIGGLSRLITEPNGRRSEAVSLSTIDESIEADRRVAAIQLDVEGHEQHALAGAMRTIARCRPLIVLEKLPDEEWLAEHLAPLGYTVAQRVDANYVLR
jgi:FkbM family methyltransferase